jgi:hypothetical protein
MVWTIHLDTGDETPVAVTPESVADLGQGAPVSMLDSSRGVPDYHPRALLHPLTSVSNRQVRLDEMMMESGRRVNLDWASSAPRFQSPTNSPSSV